MAVSKEWTLIRAWLRKTYNKEVHEFFKDLPADIDPDNTSGRSTTKAVCLIGARDSQGITSIKRENFRMLKERAGITAVGNHEWEILPERTRRNKPQVQLWFAENKSDASLALQRDSRKARISFRIMEEWRLETSANAIARQIRNDLARPLFSFRVGKYVATYSDSDKGYEFQIYVTSEVEAKRVITKIMGIRNDTPDWKILNFNNKPDLPTTPDYNTVMGSRIKTDAPRRETTVYFRYAIAKIPPSKKEYPLVDVSGKYVNALFRADTE